MGNGNNGKVRKGNWAYTLMKSIGRMKLAAIVAIVLLAVISAAYLVKSCHGSSITTSINDKIDITPTQVAAMKEIGEWEFLSIEDEEMVDTTRKGLFSSDELIRIYSGTLRLGIDLGEAKDDWLTVVGDTLKVTLPRVKLLDEDFIDEAKTQPFFETGTWNDAAREAMYRRAREKMKRRCLTKENIESAENNATKQFFQMFKAMGFKYVEVRFAPTPPLPNGGS